MSWPRLSSNSEVAQLSLKKNCTRDVILVIPEVILKVVF